MPAWDGAITRTKYFDPNVDPKEKKTLQNKQEVQKQHQAPKTKSLRTNLSVAESEPGKIEVEFQSKNGTSTGKVQMYKNIDLLV